MKTPKIVHRHPFTEVLKILNKDNPEYLKHLDELDAAGYVIWE